MDPINNPYAPGAGTPPPELAGRDELRKQIQIALSRIRLGRSAQSVLMVGLRGVGKTVLLNRMCQDAEHTGIQTLRIEAPEHRSLPAILAPQLRIALLALSLRERAKERSTKALRALAGFAKALKIKYQDIEITFDAPAEPGLADNGDLEHDLHTLLALAAEAAQAAGTALAIFIDELQYVKQAELSALITALHQTTQRQLPITLVGAGLPQIPGKMGKAKSYAERLFSYPTIGPLNDADARQALEAPALKENVRFTKEALNLILEQTHGYPYFLQEWGKHVWDIADHSPIDEEDVNKASPIVVAALDESFFRVRFDRLTPKEKRYLRAMAQLGPGPHRSGDIADMLESSVSSLAPTRNHLITKGMIYSPNHGDTAFTVPLFDQFMKRIIPDYPW